MTGLEGGAPFPDRTDPAIHWYVPRYTLEPDPDTAFRFDARREGNDGEGDPFHQAVLSFSLRRGPSALLPPQDTGDTMLTATPAATGPTGPDGEVRAPQPQYYGLPLVSAGAVVRVGYKDQDGTSRTRAFPAEVAVTPTGLLVTARGLMGDDVILAFTGLTVTAAVAVDLSCWYTVPVADRHGGPIVYFRPRPPGLSGSLQGQGTQQGVGQSGTLELGMKYAGPSYRESRTVTVGGVTTVLHGVDQLRQFDVRQSEYAEVSALGDIPSRYPSLRAVYLGAVSGTLMAVPAVYGVSRGKDGCAQQCDAILDSGANSRCRFQFSFTLGPVVDPVDLMRLWADATAHPALRDTVRLAALPSTLDGRTPVTFSSSLVNPPSFADGPRPHTFLAAMEITDDSELPAIVKANLFLRQLTASRTTPLFGRVGLRLDSVHEPLVGNVVLNLHTTSSADDLAVDLADPAAPRARNAAPLDLRLIRYGRIDGTGLSTAPLDIVLPEGATTTLPGTADTTDLRVHHTLALPDPFPTTALRRYVTVTAVDVQQAHHVLAVNGTGVNFAARGIGSITALAALREAPGITVPELRLVAGRRADSTTVDIPVTFAVSGLAAVVGITVTWLDPARPALSLDLEHDFIEHPIMVLTGEFLDR
ncbi:hypothetical protein [Streptomyces sp. NPDC058694]|uniref:hypothetical protein n=1 Tax=Streptomyces sp. NPDC058694 TaxID=3346603 RepID=UPI00364D5BAA